MALYLEEAKAPLLKNIEVNKDAWWSMVNLGHCYLLTGDEKTAEKYYRETIKYIKTESDLKNGSINDFNIFIKNAWEKDKCKKWQKWFMDNTKLDS